MAARVDNHTDKKTERIRIFMKAKMRTNTEPEVTATEATTVDTSTTVESEDAAFLLDRNTYKSIKKMDRASLEALIQDIHESGRQKGLKEAGVVDDHTGEPEINLDLRELEKQIKAVKGVGEKRAEEIMQIIEQWLGVAE
ncbi:MAG: hypothetical protein IJ906_13585 [Oscillospiraceae bacterium]|nr:hypothetical protein [Oscillospiraceae bacterium]